MSDQPQRPGAEYATDRFGIPFLLLVATFIVSAFAGANPLVRVTLGLLIVAIVMSTLRATGATPRHMRLAALFAGSLGIVIVAGGFSDQPAVLAAFGVGGGVVLALGVPALIRRIFEHEQVRFQLVVAALAAYLQIAVVFSLIYGGVSHVSDGMFFAQGETATTSFMYFSVVTMTTLGYGDLTPATNLGQALAMIQTLFGQIFLVVLIAYLVGSLGAARRPHLRRD